jgi:hypothetical protein
MARSIGQLACRARHAGCVIFASYLENIQEGMRRAGPGGFLVQASHPPYLPGGAIPQPAAVHMIGFSSHVRYQKLPRSAEA